MRTTALPTSASETCSFLLHSCCRRAKAGGFVHCDEAQPRATGGRTASLNSLSGQSAQCCHRAFASIDARKWFSNWHIKPLLVDAMFRRNLLLNFPLGFRSCLSCRSPSSGLWRNRPRPWQPLTAPLCSHWALLFSPPIRECRLCSH